MAAKKSAAKKSAITAPKKALLPLLKKPKGTEDPGYSVAPVPRTKPRKKG